MYPKVQFPFICELNSNPKLSEDRIHGYQGLNQNGCFRKVAKQDPLHLHCCSVKTRLASLLSFFGCMYFYGAKKIIE